ncbi:CBS domain-containing protein [Desulfosarcina sp.]|uniref:CBS domain-containing protein n=1 Tax=Desulfosarcina sp. TaxID=2027861 RepID=UPI0029A6497F|nr:CBS domain-containing protein [Desulfosarcina sp.]MDX2452071.1 CBS domain-containing protein [Desulfosarcina sp.]MDX2489862.1 CBS domain-containing protein [Desulfosarcina sp.]
MKSYTVKNLMVPLSEYATVSEAATLLDAVKALKEAQAAFNQKRYRHRAILVIDKNNHIVGKLSQHDVIEALEPNYKEMRNSAPSGSIHRLGFSDGFVKSTIEQYHLWEKALENLCGKAIHQKVIKLMYAPGKGEFVNERASMDEAIHRLIIGRHHSLLVTADHDVREIVGLLRLTDVFEFVSDAMQECFLK